MDNINTKESVIQDKHQLKTIESQQQIINEILSVLLQYKGMSYGYAEDLLYEAKQELRHIHYEKISTYCYQENDNHQEKHQ